MEKDLPHFPHHYSSTWRLPRAAPSSVFTLHQWNIVPHLPEGGHGNEWGHVTTLLCTWLGIIKKIPSAQQAYLGLDHSPINQVIGDDKSPTKWFLMIILPYFLAQKLSMISCCLWGSFLPLLPQPHPQRMGGLNVWRFCHNWKRCIG